jgi:hypothetical protein
MAGLVPAIHVVRLGVPSDWDATGEAEQVRTADAGAGSTTWMAGTSPAMTIEGKPFR